MFERSTVAFKSNIYPVKAENCLVDEDFLRALHDPEAVKRFEKEAYRYYPTPLQREEKRAAVHCMYAPEGDYPWGTVLQDGKKTFVCKCEQWSCREIFGCRPDVTREDIEAFRGAEEDGDAHSHGDAEKSERLSYREYLAKRLSSIGDEGFPDEVESEPSCDLPEAGEDEPIPQEEGLFPTFSQKANETDGSTVEDGSASADQLSGGTPKPVLERAAEQDSGNSALGESGFDEDQGVIVRADPSDRVFVNAGPGTGKTHTLIERLKYLVSDRGVHPGEILVLSYTRAAVSVLRERLKRAAARGEFDGEWQDIEISTFDKFCTRLLHHLQDEEHEQINVSGLDYDARIKVAASRIGRRPELMGSVSHFVVDETQDLVGPRADLVLAILKALPEECGFTLLGDRCQSLYDYQTARKPSLTTSELFFDLVVRDYRPREIELRRNYRQGSFSAYDLDPLRDAILARDGEAMAEGAKDVLSRLRKPEVAMRNVELDDKEESRSLGILTRQNAQALEMSSLLWRRGIPHDVSRTKAENWITRCIADVFSKYQGETIDRETFERLSASTDPYRDGRIWKELATLPGVHPEGARLRIEEVLLALTTPSVPPSLSAVKEKQASVFVGTVHSAKGLEFDEVWLLAEDLTGCSDSDDINEFKVAYVALSRAVSRTTLQCMDPCFLDGTKPTSRQKQHHGRYIKRLKAAKGARARRGGNRVTNIEIVNQDDVDFRSMASSSALQQYIAGTLKEGDPLRLNASREISHTDDPLYYVTLADEESGTLARMTYDFSETYGEASGGKFPEGFDEVYVDRIVTCIGKSIGAPEGARKYGSVAVWHGFLIGGFAHKDDPQGY